MSWEEIRNILGKKLGEIGQVTITPASLATVVLIIVATYWISRLLQRLLRRDVFARIGLREGTQATICRVLHYAIMCIGTFIALNQAGINLTGLAAITAVLMVGISLGLQNVTSNFISGLILLIERPVQVGDFVEVAGVQGKVRTIRGRSTTVDTLDNVSIIVPNTNFISENVTNWSFRDTKVRVHVSVGVSYGSDVDLVAETLLEAGRAHPEVLAHPEPRIQFLEFGDSSLNFDLLVWLRDASRQYFVRSDLNFAIVKAFRERDITIPFPQRDLHLRSAVPMNVGKDVDMDES
ncbi:MAG: mechanosensitive ion channel [Candidatus Poribacteria bacterium]|nr:mechanosensitive ion channel [Candidatus Poribacteria bacterium]